MLFELLGALYKSMGKDKAKPMNIVDKCPSWEMGGREIPLMQCDMVLSRSC